ncbi:sporulation protein Cse60 [Cohnella sp. GCM10012308]|uniref:sporulation protein Cse60 n=1 Tax=Cohnella sp. GCM10012308 TaxID=3317329 RepID=UPI0036235AEA
MKKKVRMFEARDIESLEEKINEFLEQLAVEDLVDIKYSIVPEAISMDTETGVYPSASYTALIIYNGRASHSYDLPPVPQF